MNKKTWKFHIPWPLCLLAMVFALPFNIYAAFEGQQGPFTMIIMGDPQMPWWPERDMPSGCNFDKGKASDLPSPTDPENTPNDKTDDKCVGTSNDQSAAEIKDSNNNVTGCKWVWKDNEDGPQHCASKIENQRRVDAIKDVTNANVGVWPSQNNTNGGTIIKKPTGIIINGDLTAFFHDWQLDDYAEYYRRQLNNYPVLAGLGNHDYQNNYDKCSGNSCYRNGVEFGHQMVVGQRVSNFPAYWVQSYDPGSLSYSWTRGNYVFIQLHNYPNYEQNDAEWPIENSRSWLENEIDEATTAGKYIVLNFHDFAGDNSAYDLPDNIKNKIDGNNVVAIFVGHIIDSGALGYMGKVDAVSSNSDMKNAFGDTIPYFNSGHSGEPNIAHKFLLVEFDIDSFTVASMHADSNGKATFHDEADNAHLDTYVITQAAEAPEPYGFVAIGVPDEDVISGIEEITEDNAGTVNVFYKTLSGDSFSQQWTQNNLGPTSVQDEDKHGSALAVGDFNGDGYFDLAAGAPFDDSGDGNATGLVSIVYGTDSGLHGKIEKLEQSGRDAEDKFGFALTAGDFNGDGYDDLAAGAPYEDVNCDTTNGVDAGAVKIFYGSASGLSEDSSNNLHQDHLPESDEGWRCRTGNFFGYALAAGDFNADSYADLAVGLYGKDVQSETEADGGGVLVFFGTADGINHDSPDFRWKKISQGNPGYDEHFGFALAIGDFDGDGYDDLAAGAPREDVDCEGLEGIDAGNVNIFYGKDTGLSGDGNAVNRKDACRSFDHMGWALAAGDFNGDGYDELAVGVPDNDRDGVANAGLVVVYKGRSGKLSDNHSGKLIQENIDPCPSGCDNGAGDKFGVALAAGDANLDGFDDLAVAAAYESTGSGSGTGVVHIFWGSNNGDGVRHSDVKTLDQQSTVLISDGREESDHFGLALAVSPSPNTAPTANAGLDQTVKEGDLVTLVGSFADPDAGDSHSFEWRATSTLIPGKLPCDPSYFNTVVSTSLNLDFTPLQDCSYSFTFKVTDQYSRKDSDTVKVTVENVIPAFRSLAIDDGVEGAVTTLHFEFFDPGVNDIIFYTIDWGDGTKTSQATPATSNTLALDHTYLDDAQNYSVKVTWWDSDGGEANAQIVATTVWIKNANPQIDDLKLSNAAIDENGEIELNVTFSDAGALDTHDITIWWGDNRTGENHQNVTSPFTVKHQYLDDPSGTAADETYTITVFLTDQDGGSDQAEPTVTVSNVDPQIEALSLSAHSINENDKTQLTVEFSDVGTLDTHDVKVIWGDGVEETFGNVSSPFVTEHHYLDDPSGMAARENYTIRVTVIDDDGGTDSDTIEVTVNNLDPVIRYLTLSPAIKENRIATLSGNISDVGTLDTFTVKVIWADPLSPKNTQTWEFGKVGFENVIIDGDDTLGFTWNPLSGDFSLSHRYLDDNPSVTQADDYTVTVEVIDDDGGSDSDSAVVTVNNVAPANLTLSAPAIDENGLTTLTGSFTDPGSLDTFTLDINWGDALSPDNSEQFDFGTADLTAEKVTWNAAARSFTVQHQYLDDNPTATASDNYTIEVTVSDDDSGSVTGHTTVTVNNVNPVATVDALTDALSGLSIAYRLNDTDDIPGDLDVVLLGTLMELAGSYTDIGALDTHSATLDWNDGTDVEAVPLAESGVNDQGLAYGITDTVSHVYASDLAPGPYNLVLMVTDDDTGADAPVATIELVDAAGALEDALADLQALIDQDTLPPETELALQAALYKLSGDPLLAGEADGDGDGDGENGALDQLEKDNLSSALAKIEQAIEWLIEAEMLYEAETGLDELDLTVAKTQLTLTAKSITEKALNAAVPLADKANEQRKLEEAEEDRNEGDAALAEQDYLAALAAYRSAVQAVVTIK